jgi:hypothetical protein
VGDMTDWAACRITQCLVVARLLQWLSTLLPTCTRYACHIQHSLAACCAVTLSQAVAMLFAFTPWLVLA